MENIWSNLDTALTHIAQARAAVPEGQGDEFDELYMDIDGLSAEIQEIFNKRDLSLYPFPTGSVR